MAFEPSVFVVESIGSGFLAVMARPVPGEWIDDEFAGIAALGIRCIVSLLESAEGAGAGSCGENDVAMVGRWVDVIALRLFRRRLPGRRSIVMSDRWLTPPANFRHAFGVDGGGGEGWAGGWGNWRFRTGDREF